MQGTRSFAVHAGLSYSKMDAKLPLTPDNYRRKFLALLEFEEEEHVRLLEEKLVFFIHLLMKHSSVCI